ncbi:MAG: signal peptidase I [Bacilli bacterium]|nr:signal peptidase I [Bacilli bacterium]
MVKIFKRITDIILVLAIILLAVYFVFRFVGKIEISEVETGSMEDGIHAGDYILIYKKNKYDVGDVITYKKKGYYITHRIIKKKNKGIVTKGDANNVEDDPIEVDSIVGKVILVGGILNLIIKFKYAIAAFLLFLYLISCYIGKEELVKETNISKKDDEKENNIDRVKNNKLDILSRKRIRKKIKGEYRKNK